jgi:hypothetical protein
MAAQLTVMNGFFERSERACTKRAITSLPVPLSPVISTEASEVAICWASLTTLDMASSR